VGDNRAEELIIVDTGLLGEAMKDSMSFVPLRRVIGVELLLENSFAGDDVGANGLKDKIPGVVGDQGSKFLFHSAVPDQIDEGSLDEGGHR
jgi:hypothetical protein